MTNFSYNQALKSEKYYQFLSANCDQIMHADNSISLSDLKSNNIFSTWFNKLDNKAKSKIDYIAGLDGDKQSVNKNELNTMLMLLDTQKNQKTYSVDGIINADSESIKNIQKNEITSIYSSFVEQGKYHKLNAKLPHKYSDGAIKNYKMMIQCNTMTSQDINPLIIKEYGDYITSAENAKTFLSALDKNKSNLMKDLEIDSKEYDNLVNIALGITEQETHFGGAYFLDTKNKTHFQYRLIKKQLADMVGYNIKSVGVSQLNYDRNIGSNPTAKALCKKYGITSDKDYKNNPEKAAIATLIVLRENQKVAQGARWQNRLKENNSKIKNKTKRMTTDDITALLWNGMGKIVPRFEDKKQTVTIDDNNSQEGIKDGTSYARLVRAYREKFFGGNATPTM